MSILIKGMEMPDKCGQCPCFHHEYPMYCQATKESSNKIPDAPYGMPRPGWCPLVEVPTPHGRLFDADELKKALDERFDEMRNMYPSIRFGPGWMLASSVIVRSPTVIEAEREENDRRRRRSERNRISGMRRCLLEDVDGQRNDVRRIQQDHDEAEQILGERP